MRELECKLPLPDPAPVLTRLRDLGACDHGTVFEQNWVYDREGMLLQQREVLRLRVTDHNPWGILTHKAPRLETTYKSREETECRVEDATAMRQILEALGYRAEWCYEKIRQTWEFQRCEIVIDRMPELGHYIEVEAADEATIDRILAMLGLDKQRNLLLSYRQIWVEHCARAGRPAGEWRFPLDFRPENNTI